MPEPPDLPAGTVTFLFTDIQGSTRLWDESPAVMMQALEQHDAAIDEAAARHAGVNVKPRGEGDSRFIVFPSASDAVRAAADMQRSLANVEWATPSPVIVRASLHTGVAELEQGDYYGSAVNRAARLRGIAHGGQTLISGATWELVREALPDGVGVRDMGEHGLKDLTRREHVFQLTIDGLNNDFPQLASLDAVPNNLPEQVTEFVGRETEVLEVEAALGSTRLLTILAPGGSGKTRLAIHVAAEMIDRYPDGVFFVGLADIGATDDIVQAVAESLGLALSSDEELKPQLLTYLTGKRQLIVFDNFEHLKDGAALVSDILRAAPNITVIATSREKLGLQGETTYALSGLETNWEHPGLAFQTSGVRLFIDGATRARSDFTLNTEDLDAVRTILELVGGMPLAILLSAAWVDMLSVDEIADEISKSLDFLETQMGDVPDRHRSIRAVFEYSWALLGDEERSVFAGLSVFRGGFTRSAAERVAGASLRSLANLASKSLVVPSPATGRYNVHELLRQYAEAELRASPEHNAEVLAAHADFFGDMLDDAAALFVQSDQPEMLRMVEADIDNIRLAFHYLLEQGHPRPVQRFLGILLMVYELRGWYPATVLLFGEVLAAFDENLADADTIELRATAAGAQAYCLILLGQTETGLAAARGAFSSLPDTASVIDRSVVLQAFALGLAYTGRSQEMVDLLESQRPAYKALDNKLWVSVLKNWMSFGYVNIGNPDAALVLLAEARIEYETYGEHYFMTWALWVEALIAVDAGRTKDALTLAAKQVERASEIGYPRGLVVAQEIVGDANVAIGVFEDAESAYVDSLRTAEQMGMVRDMLGHISKIARVRSSIGRVEDAVEMLAMVQKNPNSSGQLFGSADSIRHQADAALEVLRSTMDSAEFEAAVERGSTTMFDETVNEILGRG